MSDQRTLATRLIALRILKDLVADADTAVREELSALMLPGDRATAAVFEADTDFPVAVGHVLKTKGTTGSTTAAVTDIDALLAWCKTHAPTEVQTVELVRPAFQKRLLDAVKADGVWMDTETGECFDVDGITVTPPSSGKPVLQVKPSEGAEALVRSAWRDGRLSVEDVLALPAGAA
ncbi:MAG: hypothetical protein JWM02_3661 [Frankiales bacterium]|nr:hypothetical protein [Frankiales bacterium]